MANWTKNKITITGNRNSIIEIKDKIDKLNQNDTIGIMNALVGMKYENDSEVEYFGTQDVVIKNIYFEKQEDDIVIFKMDTIRCPPEKFCEKLSEIYDVKVELLFLELGWQVNGNYIFENNGIKKLNYADMNECLYNYDKDLFWDETNYLLDCDDEPEDLSLNISLIKEFSVFLDFEEKIRLELMLKEILTPSHLTRSVSI